MNFSPRRILIRVDGSKEIGLGHVYNMITVLHSFKKDSLLIVMQKNSKLGANKFLKFNIPVKYFNEMEISGFIPLGIINDLGEISKPSLDIKCMLIPNNVIYSRTHLYITTNVQYYDIHKIIVDDIKRGKIYCKLWSI